MRKDYFVYLLTLITLITSPVSASKWQRIVIDRSTVIQVEVVSSEKEKAKGLGNRFSLPEGMGMLFVYDTADERTFWMKSMKFPIDIIWIEKGVIVHIEKRVPPPRTGTIDRSLSIYGRGIKADMVLEVPAGYTTKKSMTLGSTIQLISE